MTSQKGLSDGAQLLFDLLRNEGPRTKAQLVQRMKVSEKTIRNYLEQLFTRTLVKEVPTPGKLKTYASIDYIPQIMTHSPLAMRWQLYSKVTNSHFTIGELATAYANGTVAQSVNAAELLLKAPALICYFAQAKDLTNEQLTEQLFALRTLLNEACDQLNSAISVFNQLVSDPRYWTIDQLQELPSNPDYVLPSTLSLIIGRLRDEQSPSTN